MTNKAIARLLHETALLIELTGGNPFRAKAFAQAARTLERLDVSVVDRLHGGTLTDIPGIGEGLEAQIRELVGRGSFGLRDDLLNAIPTGLLEVLRVKGLGAKKVRMLWQDLGVTTLEDLETAAHLGRVAALEGFGLKTQTAILDNIRLLRAYSTRRRYAEAFLQAEPILHTLRRCAPQADLAGEMRRALPTVGAVAFVVAGAGLGAVQQTLAPWLTPEAPVAEDDAWRLAGTLPDGFGFTVTLVSPAAYGTALWRATGPPDHVADFEARYGLVPDLPDEAAVYARVGLPVVPPELRDAAGVLDEAAAGTLPLLLTVDDLRGTLHNHTTYSDGAHTLVQMAEAARAMGLAYYGTGDHSRSLAVANGMPIPRVYEQQAEVRRLNERFAQDGGPAFRLFNGIESDILADGSLDYPDEVLSTFDYLVASVHTGFNMTEAEATARVLRAVENPYTTILGHPTGRLLLAREGYPLDHAAVIAACARHGVAIEVNANPYRLDLDWTWIREATRQGVMIAINPDAHATDQLAYLRWGVAVARKGGLTASQCLNALPADAFARWLAARRNRA
jgi:DNA polymerase (family 10)